MDTIFAWTGVLISVYALAFVHFLAAIPAGLALGLSPLAVILSVVMSYITSTAILLYFGDRARTWLVQRFHISLPGEGTRAYRIWERYGVIGFGFTTPLTVGAQLGALIGIGLQADSRRLFLWMSIGAVVWATVITFAVHVGVLTWQTATTN